MNFDNLCRLIARPASRRDVFKAILGSLAAAAVPWTAEAAVVVQKSVRVRVVANTERQCNFQLFNKTKAVSCPRNTTKKIIPETDGPANPNPLCQRLRKTKQWIGEATVRCVKGQVSN